MTNNSRNISRGHVQGLLTSSSIGDDRGTEVEVRENLETFVKYFVCLYEKCLTEYYVRLETQSSKPGKWADFLNQIADTGRSATEGIETAGQKASVLVGINILLNAITSAASKKNRCELKKLTELLYAFKNSPDIFKDALVQSGIEIFLIFESQFGRVKVDGVAERALRKLAHDAVNRSLNYTKANSTEEKIPSNSFIVKSVIFGKSKTYKNSSNAIPHIRAGHTVKSSSQLWNTAEIFENVGLVVVKDDKKEPNKYYHKKQEGIGRFRQAFRKKSQLPAELSKKYGFRRLINGESLESYAETQVQTEYQYVLQLCDVDHLKSKLKVEINNEATEGHLKDEIKQIKEISRKEFKKLNEFLADTQNNWKNFITRVDEKLDTIGDVLQLLTTRIPESNERNKPSILFDIREAISFKGRKDELEELHAKLQEKDKTKMPKTRIVALTGLGGIGKSELARKYVSEHAEDYDSNVIWINAETDTSLRESFCRLAKYKLNLKTEDDGATNDRATNDIVDDVYTYFSKNKSLFIFDNAVRKNEANIGVDQFLPQTSINKPYVIITSQDKEWDEIATLPLGVLKVCEAMELVKETLTEETEAEKLAKELNNHPLALRQAVAYIKKQSEASSRRGAGRFTVSEYLKEWEKNTKKLLSYQPNPLVADYLKTWLTTINKIKTEGATGKRAVKILLVMAYLAPDNIEVDQIFSTLVKNKKERDDAVDLLNKYSLVNLHEGNGSIHRLVQTATQEHVKDLGKNEQVMIQAFQLVKFQYNRIKSDRVSKILPHLETLLSHFDGWIAKEPAKQDEIEKKYVIQLLTWTYHLSSERKKQKNLLSRSLPIYEKMYGRQSLKFAKQLSKFSFEYFKAHDHKKSMKMLKQAFPIYKKQCGPNSLEFAEELSKMSRQYSYLGLEEDGAKLLDQAVVIYVKRFGPKTSRYATKLSEMSHCYLRVGYHKKAMELLDQALPIYEKKYGRGNLRLAAKLSKISSGYHRAGEHKKAADLLDRALHIYQKGFAQKHVKKFAEQLSEISSCYLLVGEHKRAVELLNQARTSYEKVYGSTSSEFVIKLTEMSFYFHDGGDHKKAVELLDSARQFYKEEDTDRNLKYAEQLFEMSSGYLRVGEHTTAVKLLDAALPIYEKEDGSENLRFAQQLSKMSDRYLRGGEHRKAIACLEQASPIYEKKFGSKSSAFAKTLSEMSFSCACGGDHRKAEELLERALLIYEENYGSQSVDFAKQLSEMGFEYFYRNDHRKAMELLDRALEIYKIVHASKGLEFAEELTKMGRQYIYLGMEKKGVKLLDQALEIYLTQNCALSIEFAKQLSKISNSYTLGGCHIRAVNLLEMALRIYEDEYGARSLGFAIKLSEISCAYALACDHKKAVEFLDRALSLFKEKYGPESSEFARQSSEMSSCYLFIGEQEKAVNVLNEALEIFKIKYRPESIIFAQELYEMSFDFLRCGEREKAMQLLDQVLEIYKTQYLPESLQFATKLSEMSKGYLRLGEHEKAVKCLEEALPIYEKEYDAGSLQSARKMSEMIPDFQDGGEHTKAMELLKRVLPIYEEKYGPESLEFAKQLSNMSCDYALGGDHSKAVQLLERALPIYEKEYSFEHFQVACVRFTLGTFYESLDINKKEEYFDSSVLIFKKLNIFSRVSYDQSVHELEKLLYTVRLGNSTWIKKLIDQGFYVLQRNHHDTVLHQAVAGDNPEVVKLILNEIRAKYPGKFSEAINAEDTEGDTPLMWAAMAPRTNSAKILLEFGPDLNKQDRFGMTALHWAAKGGHHEVLKFLLDQRADSNIRDQHDKKPEDLAREKFQKEPDDKFCSVIHFLREEH